MLVQRRGPHLRLVIRATVLVLLCAPALAAAQPTLAQPTLIQPIDCTLGETCYIQQYMDRDPTTGATDFTCGPLSYDTHGGTDFAVPTLADQAAGVPVLAAAGGTVRGVRDEMPDILQGSPDAPDLDGRDCGNGLVIDHGSGWETQYCHMALRSLRVAPGDSVVAGQPLGLVGLSGRTEFPHLHLSVRHNGEEVDPFDPDGTLTCGALPDETLWADPPPYTPGGIIGAGLATEVPDYDAIRAGLPPTTLTRDAPLVLWLYMFGGRQGDVVRLTITGPDGAQIFADDVVLDRTQAILFRAGGRRAPPEGWPPGDYVATGVLLRDGTPLSEMVVTGSLR